MIKAQLIEKYIRCSKPGQPKRIEQIIHETRYFTSKINFHIWFNSFKEELWEDDPDKVKFVEGLYVKTEELKVDNLKKPRRLRLFATFRKGVSYYYNSKDVKPCL